MFATLKLLLVYITLGPLAGILGIPWSLLQGNVKWMYWAAMSIASAGVRAAGIRVEVTGLENVPAGRACIFMSNHVSNLDPPVLLPAVPGQLSVMLKKELMSIPILGTAMRMGHFVPVERSGDPAKAKVTIETAAAALRNGLHLVAFAEGTRSRDGRLMRFKKGPFFLAMETGAPIIPVAIHGTENMMRKGSVKIHPGTAHVHMLSVIETKNYATRDELMNAVHNAINAALPSQMQNPKLN